MNWGYFCVGFATVIIIYAFLYFFQDFFYCYVDMFSNLDMKGPCFTGENGCV